ncbi:hypothetical protein MUP59_07060 [Candidatus Bathyarchaeota archaeon]|nr:hypothetical protein [Candidatus Bathyarchaeota archaeon]
MAKAKIGTKETLVKKFKSDGHTIEVKKTDGAPIFYYLFYLDGGKYLAIESFMLNPDPKITLREGILHFEGVCQGVHVPVIS